MTHALTGSIRAVSALTSSERDQMFVVFGRYYADITRAGFDRDLDAKHDVILLHDPRRRIQGFSTLLRLELQYEGRTHHAVFSGDTVVEEAYWGTRTLGHTFLRYLFLQRLKRPWQPLWWFLISKGYKTYLLMANNFPEHWPRHETTTPSGRQAILDAFAAQAFDTSYSPETGRVTFPERCGRLRQGVAAATETMIGDNERIRFFVEKNPHWEQGVELACIASMSWSMPIRYALKAIRDLVLRQVPALAAQKL